MVYLHEDLSDIVARQVSMSPVMDVVAQTVQSDIRSIAAKHRRSGEYIRSIKIAPVEFLSDKKYTVYDRYVYSDDPAALHIENGYIKRPKDDDDDADDNKPKKKPKKIPGQHIFGDYVKGIK